MGAWFEYKATGSIPKNGAVPQAEYMAKKKDADGNPELATDYRTMLKHVENFKNTMDAYGLEIIKAGEDIKAKYPDAMERFGVDVTLTGTLDIRVRAKKDVFAKDGRGYTPVLQKGQSAILDLKTTGLTDDKWNQMGWELSMLHDKVKLITQPIHYKFIEILNTGYNPPFLFVLFHPKNEFDARIIDFRCDDSHFEQHKMFIEKAIIHLLHYEKVGYEPRPSLAECSECPLKDTCKHKAKVPPISVFYLQ